MYVIENDPDVLNESEHSAFIDLIFRKVIGKLKDNILEVYLSSKERFFGSIVTLFDIYEM